MATKWGCAGCGLISNDFFNALRALPKEDHVLYAAAARNYGKAQEFVKKFGGNVAYDDYRKLAEEPNIDVIYVGTIITTHFDIVTTFLNAGKNVLCEKPLGMNVNQVKQIVALARRKNVFFMEAIWSRCLPSYIECNRRLNTGEIGEVLQVIVSFGFLLNSDRFTRKSLGGSATMDIGIYLIQFALFAFGGEKPQDIQASGTLNSEGVDETMSVTLTFKNGRVATLCCNIKCELPNEAIICGTKGMIKLTPPFWCSKSFTSPSGTFAVELPEVEGSTFNFHNSQGLMYEAQEVRECLLKGKKESSRVPHDLSILIAEILETIRLQIGVTFFNQ